MYHVTRSTPPIRGIRDVTQYVIADVTQSRYFVCSFIYVSAARMKNVFSNPKAGTVSTMPGSPFVAYV